MVSRIQEFVLRCNEMYAVKLEKREPYNQYNQHNQYNQYNQ